MAIKSEGTNKDLNSVLSEVVEKMGFSDIPLGFFTLKEGLSDGVNVKFEIKINRKQIEMRIQDLQNEVIRYQELLKRGEELSIFDETQLL